MKTKEITNIVVDTSHCRQLKKISISSIKCKYYLDNENFENNESFKRVHVRITNQLNTIELYRTYR